ncbi:MAG: hypothetical protein IKK85_03470 [Clostridia bacterium]|nr:hypothetical protein [Clostridia bacterium]
MNSKEYANKNQSVRLSAPEIAVVLERRYEIENLAGGAAYLPLYRAICGVMSKVFVIHPDCIMKIKDEKISALDVQAVYRNLTGTHIEWVAEKYKSRTERIENFTQWMRTTLYFSPEDMELDYINELGC